MIITKDMIEAILQVAPDNANMAEHLTEEIQKARQIHARFLEHRGAVADEQNSHLNRLHSLKEGLRQLQSECKHWTSRFQHDPSGGHDSCNVCDFCGKEW